jgi:uncharacterized protein (TIGR00369 family)
MSKRSDGHAAIKKKAAAKQDDAHSLAVTADELRQVLAASAFARIYNFRLHSFANGQCTLDLPFQEALERPGGIVSGSVFMTAADVAMWLAIMTRLGKDAHTVTAEMKTAFLNSARQEDVRCTAKVLKFGKSIIYGVAECRNNSDKLLTHHTITYMRTKTSQMG